jgi:hypothetical protein
VTQQGPTGTTYPPRGTVLELTTHSGRTVPAVVMTDLNTLVQYFQPPMVGVVPLAMIKEHEPEPSHIVCQRHPRLLLKLGQCRRVRAGSRGHPEEHANPA